MSDDTEHDTLPLFDLQAGRQARDEGTARVATTTASWQGAAAAAIDQLAAGGRTFCADDLVEVVGMPPHPNALGAAFIGAKKRGVIVVAGYTQGKRPESHARVQRVWRGAR